MLLQQSPAKRCKSAKSSLRFVRVVIHNLPSHKFEFGNVVNFVMNLNLEEKYSALEQDLRNFLGADGDDNCCIFPPTVNASVCAQNYPSDIYQHLCSILINEDNVPLQKTLCLPSHVGAVEMGC